MSTWDISIKCKLNSKAICIKTSIQNCHNKNLRHLMMSQIFNPTMIILQSIEYGKYHLYLYVHTYVHQNNHVELELN